MFPTTHYCSSPHTDIWKHCDPYSTYTNETTAYEPAIYRRALNLLPQPSASNETSSIRTNSKPVKANTDSKAFPLDWQPQMYQTYYNNSMGGPVTNHVPQNNHTSKHSLSIGQTRNHQRTPSTSTIASTGPASPFMQSASYPHIANTEQAPNSPSYYLESYYGKNVPVASNNSSRQGSFGNAAFMPSQAAHMSNAHFAMKGFAIDYHNSEDFAQDFAPSRQSMSSYGNNSPATPQSGVGEAEASKTYNAPTNGELSMGRSGRRHILIRFDVGGQPNPNVQLFRTESEAFRDELYNPDAIYSSVANLKPVSNLTASNAYLSPHRNLITERLQTANLARSTSPSGISRQRSPFRDNSPMATDWKQVGPVATAASIRQHQADDSVQAEFGRHRAPLRREATKTISPKDALLDYTADSDQTPLFQDSIPAGYKQHVGNTESWPSNFITQPSANFGHLATAGQPNMSFRSANGDPGYTGTPFDFPSIPQSNEDLQNNPFQANYQAASTPNFPASIPSMETSLSDAGPPVSSQESVNNHTSAPKRPDDTRANTGTYTCTYHGCTQRFESHAILQKHKRDFHRSQQSNQSEVESSPPSAAGSASPRSTESPGPSGGGMTSAAILARNSQAGPHKCTRINPSTNKPCNTIFSRPYDLTRHEDTIHNGRKQKVRCPMCREEKTFSRNDALTRHMRVVHPEVEASGKRGKH